REPCADRVALLLEAQQRRLPLHRKRRLLGKGGAQLVGRGAALVGRGSRGFEGGARLLQLQPRRGVSGFLLVERVGGGAELRLGGVARRERGDLFAARLLETGPQ